MGDARFVQYYVRVRDAADPPQEIRGLSDEEVIFALAAASTDGDGYWANVLATEAANRMGRLRVVEDQMGEGILIADRDGRVERLNPAAEAILGWRASEASGAPVHRVIHGGRDFGACACAAAVGDDGLRRHDEDEFLRRDGSVVPVTLSVSPIVRGGSVEGAVYVFRDVSERRRSEEALSAREALLRAAFEGSAAGMAVLAPDGRFIRVNGAFCRMLGFTSEELLARSWRDITLPADLEESERQFSTLLSGDAPLVEFEKRHVGRDGRPRWVEITSSVVRDGAGKPMLLVTHIHDVTERKAAEGALRESEARYRRMVETAQEGVWLIDASARTTYVNHRLADMLGYSVADMIGRPITDFMDAEAAALAREHVELRRQGTPPNTFDFRFRHRDGHDVWAIVSASGTFDDDGTYQGSLGMIVDITARKAAEQKLALYRHIFENSRDAIAIIGRDVRYLEQNAAHRDLIGYDDDELKHVTPAHHLGEETFERVMEVVKRDGAFRGELESRTRSGERLVLDISAFPLLDESGEPVCFVGMKRDVTNRRRTEEALSASEARFRRLVEESPTSIHVFDANGRSVLVNRAWERMWGTSRSSAEDYNVLEDPQLDEAGVGDLIRRCFAGETVRIEPIAYDASKQAEGGRKRWVGAIGYPLKDEEGRVREVVLIHEDVTESLAHAERVRELNAHLERRVAERTRALAAANEELEAFAYSVSHDLRAPLRGIEFLSRVILEESDGDLAEHVREDVERIHGETQRLTQLVNALLDVSRVTTVDLHPARVDVSTLARDVAASLARAEPERRVEVIVQDGLVADADPRLLRVVLQNLVGNAWKFTRRTAEARIEVGLTDVDGRAAFFVSDNGAGFDPERAARLFRPFQRLHSAAEFEGTGIGLATVQRIVRRHGGEAWAEGAPGEGATVYFTLG